MEAILSSVTSLNFYHYTATEARVLNLIIGFSRMIFPQGISEVNYKGLGQ
jgi:hypothetical protein